MATIRLDVVTPEKMVFAGDVDMILAWGWKDSSASFPITPP